MLLSSCVFDRPQNEVQGYSELFAEVAEKSRFQAVQFLPLFVELREFLVGLLQLSIDLSDFVGPAKRFRFHAFGMITQFFVQSFAIAVGLPEPNQIRHILDFVQDPQNAAVRSGHRCVHHTPELVFETAGVLIRKPALLRPHGIGPTSRKDAVEGSRQPSTAVSGTFGYLRENGEYLAAEDLASRRGGSPQPAVAGGNNAEIWRQNQTQFR